MAMVDTMESAPTRRAPRTTRRGPWPWIALASLMLMLGLGGGFWMSQRGVAPSGDRDSAAPSRDDDTSPRRTTRANDRRPRLERTPFDHLAEESLCPNPDDCEVIPKSMWDGASVNEVFDYLERRAKRKFPDARVIMFLATATVDGKVDSRRLDRSFASLQFSSGRRQFTIMMSMARSFFLESNSANINSLPRVSFDGRRKCTPEKAYAAIHGGVDKAWRKHPRSILLMTHVRDTSITFVPAWSIDNKRVDITTCKVMP
jgi:hypothetical protein